MDSFVSLGEILGDPAQWKEFEPLQGYETFVCPQCSAIVANGYQHKAWHLQNEQFSKGSGSPTASAHGSEPA